jgi:phage/plasmid-associated DNA primase
MERVRRVDPLRSARRAAGRRALGLRRLRGRALAGVALRHWRLRRRRLGYEALEEVGAGRPPDLDPVDVERRAPASPASAHLGSAHEELLLGMLGRLLYPVGLYDDWQACLMLTGVGGSGKTTVTDAIIYAGYAVDQIGYISNTIEKNFPFESLTRSSVVIAADVDKDLLTNLSQTDLHTIINGERVETNVKYGGRVTLKWVAPFMLVANVVPNWQDDQGQMTRRLVYFDFSKKPATASSSLSVELKDPIVQVQMLLRSSKKYRELAERFKQDGIMPNILAKHYPGRSEVASKVQRNNDPLVHFISETLVHTPGYYVTISNLQKYKTKFCQSNEYDSKSVQFRKEFQNIMASKGMKIYSITEIAKSPRAKSGQNVPKQAYIDNCSLSVHACLDEDSD